MFYELDCKVDFVKKKIEAKDHYNYPVMLKIIYKYKSIRKKKDLYLVNKYKNHATYLDKENGYVTSFSISDFKTRKFRRLSDNSGVLISDSYIWGNKRWF